MSSSSLSDAPLSWRLGEAVRFGWREFLAMNPPGVLGGSILPRVVLQTLFFTLLGGVVAGTRHQEFAYVGGLVLALAMTNILYVSQVPVADKDSATFWRLRTGRLHPTVLFVARSLPYPLAGFGVILVAAVVVAPVAGVGDLALRLAPMAFVYLLISFTATAAGLAAAAFVVGRRAETLASNLMGYLVMLCSGAFLPPGRVPVLDVVGAFLPGRHGLAAMHSWLRGEPWLWQLVAEAVVGIGWLGATAVVVAVQIRRAHRHGHDDFA
ncbi:ABC transporter permease [Micromonospora rifamycinica]|uniref:ABC transporter permease n=1 Tax=Micromonospora rifamycinica TaxID=291594 RepID=UPI002E29D87A|nr:ABC transporter permease [Micromonospora rifamycinica]